MDNKTFKAILEEDYRHMARMEKLLSFLEFGFSTFPHKKGFGIVKEPVKNDLSAFQIVFPTLDALIYFVEGYLLGNKIPGEDEIKKEPTVH